MDEISVYISVDTWEWFLSVFVIALALVIGIIHKNKKIQTNSEYRYYIPGLMAKIFGAISYSLVYTVYYYGGDTTAYYEAAVAYLDLLGRNPEGFLETFFLEATPYRHSYFTGEFGATSRMYAYLYFDIRTLTVIRFFTPFVLLSFKSYLITNILVGIFGFMGVWRLYIIFTKTYKAIKKELALCFLFFPSVLFWGGGVSKDSIIIICVSIIILSMFNLFIIKKNRISSLFISIFFIYIVTLIKPYVFYALAPGMLLWILHDRILAIKNQAVRTLMIPFILIFSVVFLVVSISQIESNQSEFGFIYDELEHAAVIQDDLRKEYYGGNSFDIGGFEPTISGIIEKIPIAVVSGIYRPFPWEVRTIFMAFSSIEGVFIFVLFLIVLFSLKFVDFFKHLFKEPILLFFTIYSLVFAFVIGLTTPNFGALVRFKIPFIGFYLASLFILKSKSQKKSG